MISGHFDEFPIEVSRHFTIESKVECIMRVAKMHSEKSKNKHIALYIPVVVSNDYNSKYIYDIVIDVIRMKSEYSKFEKTLIKAIKENQPFKMSETILQKNMKVKYILDESYVRTIPFTPLEIERNQKDIEHYSRVVDNMRKSGIIT